MKVRNITRPALRYFGGKWRLAPWIIDHFPDHRVYVEPFGGAASVLLRKPRAYSEVYNDLSDDVVNLFQVLRDVDMARELTEKLRLTPFADTEFQAAYQQCDDPIERARRLIIRSFMGFGALGNIFKTTGFRSDSKKSGTTPAHDWVNYPDVLQSITERLKGVIIENRPASAVLAKHDGVAALHYVDPPYIHGVRQRPSQHKYAFELTDDDHRDLLDMLNTLKGMVVLSGYQNPVYQTVLTDWTCIRRKTFADGARQRTECLWLNPACQRALSHSAPQDMFTLGNSPEHEGRAV